MGETINFWGFQDDKLIYDERKKRFVHTADMPRNLSRQYRNNTFKHVSRATLKIFIILLFMSLITSVFLPIATP